MRTEGEQAPMVKGAFEDSGKENGQSLPGGECDGIVRDEWAARAFDTSALERLLTCEVGRAFEPQPHGGSDDPVLPHAPNPLLARSVDPRYRSPELAEHDREQREEILVEQTTVLPGSDVVGSLTAEVLAVLTSASNRAREAVIKARADAAEMKDSAMDAVRELTDEARGQAEGITAAAQHEAEQIVEDAQRRCAAIRAEAQGAAVAAREAAAVDIAQSDAAARERTRELRNNGDDQIRLLGEAAQQIEAELSQRLAALEEYLATFDTLAAPQ